MNIKNTISISIVIPFHNEEKNVKPMITKLYNLFKSYKLRGEIIAIDDRSNDNTGKILNDLRRTIKNLHVITRKGKSDDVEIGYAIKEGISFTKSDILSIMMGDQSDNPKDIIKMLKKIEVGYDIVCGSRLIKGSRLINYPPLKLIMMKLYNTLFSLLFVLPVNDFSNAFKTYRSKVLKLIRLESKGFEITAEMLLKAHILGYKITEVPVSWYNRKSGKSKLGEFSLSLNFLIFRLPSIGFRYITVAMKLYSIFLFKNLKKLLF